MRYPQTKSQRSKIRATELNNKNIYVLQKWVSSVLLQIVAASLLQIRTSVLPIGAAITK